MRQWIWLTTSISCLGAIAEAENQPGWLRHFEAENMPEVDIRPLPIPEDYAFPYIVEDVERGDYAACEQKLLAVLPEYEHRPEVRLFILDQLGFFAQFQAYAAEKKEDQLAHLNRTLDYYSLGDSLASADPVRFKLHRATFLRGQAEALEELGRLEEALQKTMAMIPMTGIGTGSKKDAAGAGAGGVPVQEAGWKFIPVGWTPNDASPNLEVGTTGGGRSVSPFQIRIGPFGRVPTTLNERRTIMTGNALKNTKQFEPISREAADKLVAIWRLALTESLYAAISPKNNRPLRYEAKPGSSFK